MSADAATANAGAPADHHGAHPTDRQFVITAAILAGVTAAEVAWSYLPWGESLAMRAAEIAGLLVMMAFKFFMVASVFMHLKFDNKILTRIFYAGLTLAVVVYLAVLATFEFFTGNGSVLPN